MRISLWLAGSAAALVLTGCSTFIDQRGNLPEEDRLAQIQPGVSTREQVQQILGTPSSTSTFDDTTWYYISKKTEQWAFLAPDTIDQKVIAIDFDSSNVVRDIRRRGLDDAKEVAMVDRETPTPGKTLGFFEQLFGNLGKFNSQGANNATRSPGGSRSGSGLPGGL
jgi:outer membrane protein assembly factor BamE (lipoprotein component of BamABCDE complex)